MNAFFQNWITHECRNEFTGAFRFIPKGETARENHHLCTLQCFFHTCDGIFQHCRCQVSHIYNFGFPANSFQNTRCIVFTVGAREYRNHSFRLCNFCFCCILRTCIIAVCFYIAFICCTGWEDIFQCAFPDCSQFIQGYTAITHYNLRLCCSMTNQDCSFDWRICFHYNCTIVFVEHCRRVYTFQHFKTNLITQSHFEYCFCYAAFS